MIPGVQAEDGVFGFTTSFTPHHSNPPTNVPRHPSRHVSRHRSPICQDIVHPRIRRDRLARLAHVMAEATRRLATPGGNEQQKQRNRIGPEGAASVRQEERFVVALAKPAKRNDVLTHHQKKRNDDPTHQSPKT